MMETEIIVRLRILQCIVTRNDAMVQVGMYIIISYQFEFQE